MTSNAELIERLNDSELLYGLYGVTATVALEAASTITALEERIRVLSEHIREQIEFVETRIQDGIEMGATVWRIALEDVVRVNRAALNKSNDDYCGIVVVDDGEEDGE